MHSIQIIFFAVIAFIIPANIMLSLRGRGLTPLFYSAVILCVGLLELASLDIAREYLEAPERLRPLFGGLAAIFAAFFWDRLLLLRTHAPRARYAVFVIGGCLLATGIASLFLKGPAFGRVQAWLGLAYLGAIVFTGAPALRRGYRPALYSAIGLLVNIAFAAIHVGALLGVLPINFFTGHALQLGFPGQFLFFMLSLSSRAALSHEADVAGATDRESASIEPGESDSKQKYEKSKLMGVNLDELHERLLGLMERERLYCDEDLTLETLAGHCGVTRHELSEFLNNRLGVNFNRFVNDYRVGEARELLKAQPDRSVLDIAFASGFNSKTRFNIEFKRVTGQTPRDYRRTAAQATGDENEITDA